MLLIFFLIVSSMDTDKGLQRQLPPPAQLEQLPMDVSRDNVMTISLDAADRLTCDGEAVGHDELQGRVAAFVEGNRLGHILQVEAERQTSYDAYFQMQDAVVAAYRSLRESRARQVYGRPLRRCSADERDAVAAYYPQRISERIPEADGQQKGGRR